MFDHFRRACLRGVGRLVLLVVGSQRCEIVRRDLPIDLCLEDVLVGDLLVLCVARCTVPAVLDDLEQMASFRLAKLLLRRVRAGT